MLHYNKIICFHLYNVDKNKIKYDREINHNPYNDNISYERQKHLLNIKKTNNTEALKDIEKYNLGTEKTLRDFERFLGVDFRKKTSRSRAEFGVFEKWQETLKIDEVKNIFNNIYKK